MSQSGVWEEVSLSLSEFGFKGKKWDNLWEICFVLNHNHVYDDKGFIQIDKIYLSRTQNSKSSMHAETDTMEGAVKTVIKNNTFNNSPVNTGKIGIQNINCGNTSNKENNFSNNQGQINIGSGESKINAKIVKND